MAKFRKKPVVIEAFRWTGDENQTEGLEWINDATKSGKVQIEIRTGYLLQMFIKTLEDGANGEAKHVASPGDWIIRGVKGELYPCKPDIFAMTYEPADTPLPAPPSPDGNLLGWARDEIRELRQRNEVLEVQVHTMNTMAALLFAKPEQNPQAMREDVLHRISKRIEEIKLEHSPFPPPPDGFGTS